jgi:endonuclease/exonuclease/phosphatase family metal-dependent hydrolase
MRKRWSFIISFVLLLNIAATPVHAAADKRDVTVMTRNMDAGTDLQWFFAVDVPTAASLTLAEVIKSDYPGRAGLLADEIGKEAPDLIGLQEVSLIQAGPPAGPPTIVLDQLQLLLAALAARNLHYAPVAINTLTSVTVPTSTGLLAQYTDHDVVLARTDLKQSELALSNIQEHIYAASFNFPIGGQTLPVLRGYISVDAKVRGKTFRFIDTHIENLDPGKPDLLQPQFLQAKELLDFTRTTALPVVLAGDFNCNAEPGPDHGLATDAIVASGFLDTWRVFPQASVGFTWPLFLEDFNAGTNVQPFERIDLIFARYLNVLEVHLTGLTPPWPSDHAGVVSTIQLVP